MKKRISVILAGSIFLCLVMSLSTPWVNGEPENISGPTLKNGGVSPENGVWGSKFSFRVTYSSSRNVGPAEGYPKVFLDGTGITMEENKLSDDNFADGKIYRTVWTAGIENIENHSFYFMTQSKAGENARYPDEGTLTGPLVIKKSASLNVEIERKDGKIHFSGTLRGKVENEVLVMEKILFSKVLEDENKKIGSSETSENGEFAFSAEAPEEKGVHRYKVSFQGNQSYKEAESDSVYLSSLDAFFLVPLASAVLLGILAAIWLIFTWGMDRTTYLLPLIWGALAGLILIPFLGMTAGPLIGGLVIGYFLSRKLEDWKKHLKVGVVGGVFVYAAEGFLTLSNIFSSPERFGFPFSLSQMEILKRFTLMLLPYAFLLAIMMGLGALLGRTIRKLLK